MLGPIFSSALATVHQKLTLTLKVVKSVLKIFSSSISVPHYVVVKYESFFTQG